MADCTSAEANDVPAILLVPSGLEDVAVAAMDAFGLAPRSLVVLSIVLYNATSDEIRDAVRAQGSALLAAAAG